MNVFSLSETAGRENSTSKRAKSYVMAERPLEPIREVVIKGPVDVMLSRYDTPTLMVAGETDEAVASVKTTFKDGKLLIEREVAASDANNCLVFNGGSFKMYLMGGTVNGRPVSEYSNLHKAVVGLALPEAPAITLKGSGNVTLVGVQQPNLDLVTEGSGDIRAHGQVEHLDVEIVGAGDVDATKLIAERAHLSIAGSGDIEVFVRTEVHARIAGSGDIVVHCDPLQRDHRVTGSGEIRFR